MFKLTITPKRTQPDERPDATLLKAVTAVNGTEQTCYHRPGANQTQSLRVHDKK